MPRANYSVLRVKRNIFAQSTVGGIFLNRQGGAVDHDSTHAGVTESRTGDAQFGFTFNDTSLLTFDAIRDYDLLTEAFRLGNGVVPIGEYRWTTGQVAYSSSPRHRVAGTGCIQAGTY